MESRPQLEAFSVLLEADLRPAVVASEKLAGAELAADSLKLIW